MVTSKVALVLQVPGETLSILGGRSSPSHLDQEKKDMTPLIAALFLVVAVAIIVILMGILAAVKNGFNEVIRGLQALEKRHHEPR